MEPNSYDSPAAATSLLAERIAQTLRTLIEVRPSEPDPVVARPGFWERCQPIALGRGGLGAFLRQRIFVDGFRGACQWNSLKVYRDALEPGLSLWCGYALYGGAWYHHAWCMLDQRIVETTVPFQIYHGAALSTEEVELFAAQYADLPLDSRKREMVATCKGGVRADVWGEDVKAFAETIGRERDWQTGQLKNGLGR
jgi:hypothetical protein